MENEIWKDIEGYEGLYQVSNLGEVKSLARPYKNQYGECGLMKEKLLTKKIVCFDKTKKQTEGYFAVCLSKNNTSDWKRVHIIVAKNFIPNPENKPQVNHIDGNKFNNNVNNLEWVTHQENCQHAWDTGLNHTTDYKRKIIKERQQKLKTITNEMVLDIYNNCELGSISNNAHTYSKKYGICVQTVCNIKKLKNETYKK